MTGDVGDERGGEPTGGRPGIRTFLVADVRGYTAFTQERGDEAAAELAARFAAVAREAVDSHGGSVIELRGDEALAVFESAREAIRAATLLQQRFLEETEADPALPLPVGIGLDAGEAVPLEGGYRGGALNLAARLCSQAGPGEILASQGVVHLARKVEGVRVVDRGQLRLKGMEEPVGVFQLISEAGDPAERFRQLAPPPPARAPSPLRLVRRHPVVTAALAVALAAAVAAPLALTLGGEAVARGSEPVAEPIVGDALAMIDLGTGTLEGSVPLESRPGDVAVGAGGVWVTLPDRGVVMRIDPATMTVRNTIPVGADPAGVAIGNGSVWVANAGSSTVSRISPETESVVQTISVPGGPTGIAAGAGGVWVANNLNASVSRLDPESGEVTAVIAVDDGPVDVSIDDRGVWVANSASGTVSRVDPDTGVVQPSRVGNGPRSIAAGPDGAWVANFLDGTIARIDPATNAVVQTIPVGPAPTGLALSGGSVWVSDGSDGSLATVEPGSGSATTMQLGSEAGGDRGRRRGALGGRPRGGGGTPRRNAHGVGARRRARLDGPRPRLQPRDLEHPHQHQRRSPELPADRRARGHHARSRPRAVVASADRRRSDVHLPASGRAAVLERGAGSPGGLPPRDRAGVRGRRRAGKPVRRRSRTSQASWAPRRA